MSWGFEIGRVYNRRADIHGRFGGQQQGGIITPSKFPLVIIVTGEEGLQHGYSDRFREDGVFDYFGEGQVGPMELVRGNQAIARHSVDGKSLLLFRKTKSGLRFEGEMVCESYRTEIAKDREGNDREAIVFELRALGSVVEVVDDIKGDPTNLSELFKRAMESASVGKSTTGVGTRTVYQRSNDIRLYVLTRASGVCEGCESPAPFTRKDGSPYLEPHHIRRVSDGGPDHPAFVIALCPNCHRRVHAGADGPQYNASLLDRMKTIQPDQ